MSQVQEELSQYDDQNDFAREYTLEVKKPETRQNRNNFVNFKGNNIVNNKNTKILAGVGALFLAYKLLK